MVDPVDHFVVGLTRLREPRRSRRQLQRRESPLRRGAHLLLGRGPQLEMWLRQREHGGRRNLQEREQGSVLFRDVLGSGRWFPLFLDPRARAV